MDHNRNEISETGSADGQPAITRQDILDAKAEKYLKQLIKDTFIAVMFIMAFMLANKYIPAMRVSSVRYLGAGMVALSSTNALGSLIQFFIYKSEAARNRKKK